MAKLERFDNRLQAGALLAQRLQHFAGRTDVIVLALPRGGVPVGFAVARELDVPLDILLVRKLGVSGHEEYTLGQARAPATHAGTIPYHDKRRFPSGRGEALTWHRRIAN